jgi:hypothetical protein
MTKINERTVTDKKGQEIVVEINADHMLKVSFQRTGIDEKRRLLLVQVTESGIVFENDFPLDVSKSEEAAIIKAAADMLVSNVFGS